MSYQEAVRPHLLDEAAICTAIRVTGLGAGDRSLIAELLTEHYIVDLDLLQSAIADLDRDADFDLADAA